MGQSNQDNEEYRPFETNITVGDYSMAFMDSNRIEADVCFNNVDEALKHIKEKECLPYELTIDYDVEPDDSSGIILLDRLIARNISSKWPLQKVHVVVNDMDGFDLMEDKYNRWFDIFLESASKRLTRYGQ